MRFFILLLILVSCVSDPSKQSRNAYLLEEEDNTLSEVIEDITILLDLYPINGEIDKENLIPENTPHSIAAGIIFFISQLCNLNISKKDVHIVTSISEVTINKCYKKLETFENILIPQSIRAKYIQ